MRRRSEILAVALATLALSAAAQSASAPPAFVQRDKGHCVACHQVPEGAGPTTRADLGPRLAGARMRELGRARLRELIEDPTRANPGTVMPPFGRHRILEAAEIDRIVEYLHALP
jgi:L-cysteine S-thiosulfotransferase